MVSVGDPGRDNCLLGKQAEWRMKTHKQKTRAEMVEER